MTDETKDVEAPVQNVANDEIKRDGWAALAKARAGFAPIVMDKVNPHFKNRYASLSAVMAAVVPALSANGLGLVTKTGINNGYVVAETAIVYRGETLAKASWPVGKCDLGQQALGSALTYARRYTVSAVLGVCADEDDDGEAAQGATAKAKAQNASAPF